MPKTVLVVDDDPDFLDLLVAVLTLEGYQVVTCSDAREAYRKVRQYRPDVVLVDLMMPNESGWQVIDQIKSDPATRITRVILCTGAGEALQNAEKLGRPCDAVLLKPFNLDELLYLISRATRSRAS